MLKHFLLLPLCLFCTIIQAQIFDTPGTILDTTKTQFISDAMAKGDINQDGLIDFASRLGYYINEGNGNYDFTEMDFFGRILGMADIDNDGDTDLISERSLKENDGDNNFSSVFVPFDGTGVHEIVNYGDFNGDGLIDLVVVDLITFYDDELAVLYNQGDFTFEKELIDIAFDNGFIHVVDFNDDGKLDILSIESNFSEGAILFYTNNGTSFDLSTEDIPSNISNDYINMEDMDDDGDLDIVYSGSFSTINWLQNNNGNYSSPKTINGNISANWMAIGDINDDGLSDVVAINSDPDPYDLGYMLNEGDGNFGDFTTFNTLTAFSSIIWQWPNSLDGLIQLEDLDGDDLLDLIVTDVKNEQLLWYKNQTMSSGLEAYELETGYTIYPNPATKNISIEFEEVPSENLFMQVLNSSGIIVEQFEILGSNNTLDLTNLSTGIYFYSIIKSQSKEIISRGKMIKH